MNSGTVTRMMSGLTSLIRLICLTVNLIKRKNMTITIAMMMNKYFLRVTFSAMTLMLVTGIVCLSGCSPATEDAPSRVPPGQRNSLSG